MKFPWHKYEEVPLNRRNTLQIFITNTCNLSCEGCFARNIINGDNRHMSLEEYNRAVETFLRKGGKQVNLLGGEPLLHPKILDMIEINRKHDLKTTIYTNGTFLGRFRKEDFEEAKIRVSIYGLEGHKGAYDLAKTDIPFDANFMVSRDTILSDLLLSATHMEEEHCCNVFFISSIRELDNPRKEFFDDTPITMPVLKYKEMVHNFLAKYEGAMAIHVSKRGVFESTQTPADNKCGFANYFPDGKIIQCPYDVVNLKFQRDYEFGCRDCQQNNSCLMSKIVLKPKG